MSLFKSPFLPPWKGPLPETFGRLEASLIVPVPLESNVAVDPEEAVQY
jgi:hypothetical protein